MTKRPPVALVLLALFATLPSHAASLRVISESFDVNVLASAMTMEGSFFETGSRSGPLIFGTPLSVRASTPLSGAFGSGSGGIGGVDLRCEAFVGAIGSGASCNYSFLLTFAVSGSGASLIGSGSLSSTTHVGAAMGVELLDGHEYTYVVVGSASRPVGASVAQSALRVQNGAFVVPEPATLLLFGSALLGIGATVRRRRRLV